MSWKDKYLQASLAGVEFHVKKANRSGGRNIVAHKFVNSESVEYEDTGALEDNFTFNCYLVDDNYYSQRDALEKVLNLRGPKNLIHPYRGKIKVRIGKWTGGESVNDGGMISYSISCHRITDEELNKSYKNSKTKVYELKKDFLRSVGERFEKAYSIASKPTTAISDVRETIDKSLVFIDGAKKLAGSFYEFKREVENLRGDIIALSLNGQHLYNSFKDMIAWGTDPADNLTFGATKENATIQSEEQRQIKESTDKPVVSTPAVLSGDDSYPAKQIQHMQKLVVLGVQAGLITEIDFKTVDDAQVSQEDLFEFIDEILNDDQTTDQIFANLEDLKHSIYEHLQGTALNLPVLVDYDNTGHTDVLSLSYELYGNIDNAQDLADRNNITHPGFIPMGKIQVRVFGE